MRKIKPAKQICQLVICQVSEKITLLQLDGVLTPEEYKKCVEVGVEGM